MDNEMTCCESNSYFSIGFTSPPSWVSASGHSLQSWEQKGINLHLQLKESPFNSITFTTHTQQEHSVLLLNSEHFNYSILHCRRNGLN